MRVVESISRVWADVRHDLVLRVAVGVVGLVLAAPSALAETRQRFEGDASDEAYALHNANVAEGGADAVVLQEGENHYLRLAVAGPPPSHTSVTFSPAEAVGPRIVADFDFRITAVTGEADGLGFALLDSGNAAFATGAVGPPGVAEEPAFAGSIGVGFDVYQSCTGVCDAKPDDEPVGHHISIHYGPQKFEFNGERSAGLVVGVWVRARVVVEFGEGGAWVSVMFAPAGQASCTGVERLKVPGPMPYAPRVWFGARNGGTVSLFDLDNVRVTTSNPATNGKFDAPVCGPMVPIHAAALPDGRVLAWDRHDYTMEAGPWIVEPVTGFLTAAAHPGFDAFCAGHTFLAEGSLFLAGGHWLDNLGVDRASQYDIGRDRWKELPPMNDGRWYPTTTMLGDGSVLVLSGTVTPTSGPNELPQIWQSDSGTWRNLYGATKDLPLYPWTYPAPDGRVFVAGPQKLAQFLDLSGQGAWQETLASAREHRDYGSSVSYAPGRILIAGGSQCANGNGNCLVEGGDQLAPTAMVETIDLNGSNLGWVRAADMNAPRRHFTTVVLADGSVLAIGGTESPGFNEAPGAVFEAELWDPANPTAPWTVLERSFAPRIYHHTALLLPDARVWFGGGGHPAPGAGADQPSFEILSPPYLFNGARPRIVAAPAHARHGETFRLRVEASGTPVVNLARMGAVTHDFDQSALFIPDLPVATAGEDRFDVTMPDNANLVPPGPYMLFALDDGVPSLAAILLVRLAEGPDGGEGGAGGQGGAGGETGVGGDGGASGTATGGSGGGAGSGQDAGAGGEVGGSGGGPGNRPPVALPMTLAVPTKRKLSGELTAFDPDGTVVSFAPESCEVSTRCVAGDGGGRWTMTGTRGSLELGDNGEFTYSAGKKSGTDRFEYKAVDDEGDEGTGTLTVTVFKDGVGPIDDDGCGCRIPGRQSSSAAPLSLLAALATLALRRGGRRRHRSV